MHYHTLRTVRLNTLTQTTILFFCTLDMGEQLKAIKPSVTAWLKSLTEQRFVNGCARSEVYRCTGMQEHDKMGPKYQEENQACFGFWSSRFMMLLCMCFICAKYDCESYFYWAYYAGLCIFSCHRCHLIAQIPIKLKK